MVQQELRAAGAPGRAISPLRELGAYEALWSQKEATFKRIADKFRANPDALPSDLVAPEAAEEMASWVLEHMQQSGVSRFGVRVHRAAEYPRKLRDARHPVEVLTYAKSADRAGAPRVVPAKSNFASSSPSLSRK